MPAVISPNLTAAVAQRPSAGTARNNDSTEGRRFDMALEQSRAAHAGRTEEPAELAEATDNGSGDHRRTGRGHERKSKLSADDVMAMLAPLPAPIVPLAAQLQPGNAGARTGGAATAGLDPLAGDAATGPARDAGAAAADAKAAAHTAPDDHDTTAPAQDASHADARTAADPAKSDAVPSAAADGAALPSPADTVEFMAAANAAAGQRPARTAAAGSAASQTQQTQQAGATAAAASASAGALPAGDALAAAMAAGGATATEGTAAKPGDAAADAAAEAPPLLPTWQATANAAPADRTGAASPSTPVLSLAPRVGDDAWGPAIAQQLIRMSATGHHVAKLNLNPAELGPLQVTLTLSDNQTQAMFVSAHDAVRKAVEAALPQLRSTLASQGIELGHTSVGAQSQQPSGQGAGFAGQDAPRQRGQADYPGAARSPALASVAATTPPPVRARAMSGLDTFA